MTNLTHDVLEMCIRDGINWSVECAPQRGVDECTSERDDVYWKAAAHVGTFWDLPRTKAIYKTGGAKRYKVAMCKQGMDEQKYIEVMVGCSSVEAADEELSGLWCDHSWHRSTIGGVDEDGRSIAQMSEQYTPMFSDTMTRMITAPLIPDGETAAAKPPFSGEPHRPAMRVEASIMAT